MSLTFNVRCAEGETPERALDKLIPKQNTLHLYGNNINRIPTNINMLPSITSISMSAINLHHNYKKAIDKVKKWQFEDECADRSVEIFEPLLKTNVKNLTFNSCVLTKFPRTVFSALNIRSVSIECVLDGLDITGLCYCKSIQELNISKKMYIKSSEEFILPKEICFLTNLTHLIIGECNMTEIPEVIGKLTALIKLELVFDVKQIKTEKILCDFSQLQNLKRLQLAGFYGNTLPYSIGFLNSLKSLDIRLNDLDKFPAFVLNLPMLELLSVKRLVIDGTPPYLYGGRDAIYVYEDDFACNAKLNIKDYRMYWILIHEISVISGLPFGDLARMCDFHIDLLYFYE